MSSIMCTIREFYAAAIREFYPQVKIPLRSEADCACVQVERVKFTNCASTRKRALMLRGG